MSTSPTIVRPLLTILPDGTVAMTIRAPGDKEPSSLEQRRCPVTPLVNCNARRCPAFSLVEIDNGQLVGAACLWGTAAGTSMGVLDPDRMDLELVDSLRAGTVLRRRVAAQPMTRTVTP